MKQPPFCVRGFTLIELLVVIGIISLLLGILAPVLSRTRQVAQTAKCAAHLKSLGAAWTMYADQYADALPHAVSMPQPIGSAPDEVTIMRVLSPYVSGNEIYQCPADDRGYFRDLGTSYEYLPGLAIALDPANAAMLANVAKLRPDIVPILSDAAEFHPPSASVPSPYQTVYHDAHVAWLFDELPANPLD